MGAENTDNNNNNNNTDNNNNNNNSTTPISTDLSLSCATEFNVINYQESGQELLAMATVKAPNYEVDDAQRTTIDLAAVIDISGSMAGEKLTLVKETMEYVITNLTSKDRLALVAYDDHVEVLFNFMNMDDAGKEKAKEMVKGMKDRGSTNLCGGLIKGIDLMRERKEQNQVSSVLLFTDGQANVGYTKSDDIVKAMREPAYAARSGRPARKGPSILEKMISESKDPVPAELMAMVNNKPKDGEIVALSCSVNTFGFGSDHDPNLLRKIAEAGEGVYYFIKDSATIPSSFADCIGGLVSVVGQNIKLKIEARQGVLIRKIHAKYPTQAIREGIEYVITCPDLQSEESKDILFSLVLPSLPQPDEQYGVARLSIDYFNAVEKKTVNGVQAVVGLKRSDGASDVKANFELDKHRNRIMAAEAMEKANELAANNLEQARSVLRESILRIQNSASAEDDFSKGLIKDMQECLDKLKDKVSYETTGKYMMTTNVAAHYNQRSTSSEYQAQQCYQTKSRNVMKSKFTK